MKKIFTAVTILVAIAITESCRKQQVDKIISAQKKIKQSPRHKAGIVKL